MDCQPGGAGRSRTEMERMIKRIWKRFWPLITVGLLLVAVGAFFLLRPLFPDPQAAVEGYIRSSMKYDVDGMMFFASDYQKKALAGNADIPEETLRENLKEAYRSAEVVPQTGEIAFLGVQVTTVEEGTERYSEYLKEYGYKGDPENVSGIALVTAECRVAGKHFADYRVVAVKCGLRWYYGFITMD